MNPMSDESQSQAVGFGWKPLLGLNPSHAQRNDRKSRTAYASEAVVRFFQGELPYQICERAKHVVQRRLEECGVRMDVGDEESAVSKNESGLPVDHFRMFHHP